MIWHFLCHINLLQVNFFLLHTGTVVVVNSRASKNFGSNLVLKQWKGSFSILVGFGCFSSLIQQRLLSLWKKAVCPYWKCHKDWTVATLSTLLYWMWIMWFFLLTSFSVVLGFFSVLPTLLLIKIGKLCWYPRRKSCKTLLVLFCNSKSKTFKFNLSYNTVSFYLFSKFCYLYIIL